jgi:hypothetical protein
VDLVVRWNKTGDKQNVAMEIAMKDEANKVISYIIRNASGNKKITDCVEKVMESLTTTKKVSGKWLGLDAWATRYSLYPEEDDSETDRPKKRKEPRKKKKSVRSALKSVCVHDPLELKGEENAGYCGVGSYLHGVECHECKVEFVMKKDANEEMAKLQFVPKAMHACYSCKDVGLCGYALCSGCYQTALATSGQGRTTRTKDP